MVSLKEELYFSSREYLYLFFLSFIDDIIDFNQSVETLGRKKLLHDFGWEDNDSWRGHVENRRQFTTVQAPTFLKP